jgi:pseudouridine kinase
MNLTTKGIIQGRGNDSGNAMFVVVIGSANVDIHGSPAKKLRMRDSNPGTVHTSAGGVARNIAENLARLGANCRLISAVGNDQHGRMLLQQGRNAGIDMRYVAQLESAPTSAYLSVLDLDGDMHVAISDMTIIDALDSQRLRMHETMLRQAALIVIDTNLGDDALAWLSDTFTDDTLFVDTVSTTKALRIKPYLAAVHTLKPSLNEAEAIAGMKATTKQQLPKLADWFHQRGVQRIFITLGRRGVFYSAHGQQGIAKPLPGNAPPKNAGGAGDAFLAGVAFSWLNDWPLEKTVQFSLAAANVALSHEMTNSPNLSLAAINLSLENDRAY